MRAPVVVISIYDDLENRHYAGGGPAVVRKVAARLSTEYEVVVVTAGDRWRRSRRDGVHHVHLPVAWAGPRLGQVLWALLLPVVAATWRYDVWIESFTPPFSSNLLPLVARRPVIGLAQALSGREMARRYGTRLPLRVERRLLHAYDDVVVLNASDRDAVASASPATRVHLIPNVVDPPSRPLTDAATGGYALFLGRIDVSQKGLDLLLDAYREPGEDLLPLRIAGGGRPADEERLQALVDAAGPLVSWSGPVHGRHKEDLFEGCAFLVVPSREESFSLVALEAMARGRPVVHFDLPQLSWIPVACGISVPRFDVARLRSALSTLSVEEDLRSRAGHRAAGFAAAHLGSDGFKSYSDLVGAVLARGRRHAPTPC